MTSAHRTEALADPMRQPLFHRVFRADPGNVRRTLIEIRSRFSTLLESATAGRLELVLAEVLNNVGEHGAPTPDLHADDQGDNLDGGGRAMAPGRRRVPLVHLALTRHTTGIACAISDDGRRIPANCLIQPSMPVILGPDHTLPEGGFGWFLIHDLTQSLCYFREGHRNFLAFCVPWEDTENQR
ncbi:ATP-binding protein [Paracoccus pacificus]|uniref:ATP-binding protein n=1 Tax=Paracoccus pacificus TaxID=1463598 RepID=A0ABW4R7W7_9RHOB